MFAFWPVYLQFHLHAQFSQIKVLVIDIYNLTWRTSSTVIRNIILVDRFTQTPFIKYWNMASLTYQFFWTQYCEYGLKDDWWKYADSSYSKHLQSHNPHIGAAGI